MSIPINETPVIQWNGTSIQLNKILVGQLKAKFIPLVELRENLQHELVENRKGFRFEGSFTIHCESDIEAAKYYNLINYKGEKRFKVGLHLDVKVLCHDITDTSKFIDENSFKLKVKGVERLPKIPVSLEVVI